MYKKIFKKNILFLIIFFLLGCTNKSNLEVFDIKKISQDQNVYSVIIVGSGPAGLTAGIYSSLANLKTLIIEGDLPGGALTYSHSVKNWPGKFGKSGQEILKGIREQAEITGANFLQDKVIDIDFSNWPYKVQTNNNNNFYALSTIICMGATPNFLNILGEKEFWGHGVSNCAVCDGSLCKDKIVAVVGGGNSALTEASYLANIAKKVYIIVRKNRLKISVGQLLNSILSNKNIEILYNSEIRKINGENNQVVSVDIYNNKNKEQKILNLNGVFLAIGAKPNSEIFKNKIDLDQAGYIITKEKQKTNIPGVFAAGDISNPDFKQAILAAGDGARAALEAQDFLKNLGFALTQENLNKNLNILNKESLNEFNGTVKEISGEQEFSNIINKNKLIFIDFYSTLCIPCKQMVPVIEKLAENYKNKVIFLKINISNNLELAKKFNISSVPTFIFIEDKKEIKRIVGKVSFDVLNQELK